MPAPLPFHFCLERKFRRKTDWTRVPVRNVRRTHKGLPHLASFSSASILYLKGSPQLAFSLGAKRPNKKCSGQLHTATNRQYVYHSKHICCLCVLVLWLPNWPKSKHDHQIREVALSREAVSSATATCSR